MGTGQGALTARLGEPLRVRLSAGGTENVNRSSDPTAPLPHVGSRPALVLGTFGRGRVACLTLTAHGAPAKGDVPFWQWRAWPTVLRNVIWWITGQDHRF